RGLEIGGKPIQTSSKTLNRTDFGVRLRDLDKDGRCEIIVSNDRQQAILGWSPEKKTWTKLPFTLPKGTMIVDAQGQDNGLRCVDLNEDGFDDVLQSNEMGASLHLFHSMQDGWSHRVDLESQDVIDSGFLPSAARLSQGKRRFPMIVHKGTNNGAWFHSRHLW